MCLICVCTKTRTNNIYIRKKQAIKTKNLIYVLRTVFAAAGERSLPQRTTTHARTTDDGDARRLLSDDDDGGEKRTGGDGAQTRRTTRDDAQGTNDCTQWTHDDAVFKELELVRDFDAVGSAGYARGRARDGAGYEEKMW